MFLSIMIKIAIGIALFLLFVFILNLVVWLKIRMMLKKGYYHKSLPGAYKWIN